MIPLPKRLFYDTTYETYVVGFYAGVPAGTCILDVLSDEGLVSVIHPAIGRLLPFTHYSEIESDDSGSTYASISAIKSATASLFQQRAGGDDTVYAMELTVAIADDGDTFTLPADGTNDFVVEDWGDGAAEAITTANPSHTYASAGTYTILVSSGASMTTLTFGNDSSNAALLTGLAINEDVGFTNNESSFQYCVNLVDVDISGAVFRGTMKRCFANCTNLGTNSWNSVGADTSEVTNMSYMLLSSTYFNGYLAFDTSNCISFYQTFYQCTSYNQVESHFDTSVATTLSYIHYGNTAFKQSLAYMTFDSVSSSSGLANMCTDCDINEDGTTTNYDETLVAWAALDYLPSSVTMIMGSSEYSSTGETARASIISNYSWAFTDGGLAA